MTEAIRIVIIRNMSATTVIILMLLICLFHIKKFRYYTSYTKMDNGSLTK